MDQDTAKFYFLEVNTRLQARSCMPSLALCAQSWRALASMTAGMDASHTAGMLFQDLLSFRTLLQGSGGACMQVEHGITEMVSGLDLVEMQLELQVPGLKARHPCRERERACGLRAFLPLGVTTRRHHAS